MTTSQWKSHPAAGENTWKWGLAAFAVVAAAIAFRELNRPTQYPSDLPLTSRDSDSPDPCSDAQNCVVVYLAPWCSACRQFSASLPTIRSQLENSAYAGIKVVVGAASAAEIRSFSEQITAPVFLDTSGELQKRLGIDRFPSIFIVRTADSQIIASSDAAIRWINETLQQKAKTGQPATK